MPVRLILTIVVTIAPPVCFAAEQIPPTESVSTGSQLHFESDVRSILKTHCFQCHGEEEDVGGGLDLRLVKLMQKGGDSGTAIVPGKPEDSLLFQRISAGEMPPDEGKQLNPREVAQVKAWIAAGASTARPEPDSLDDSMLITQEELNHWAFRPVKTPAVPNVKHPLVTNPIDAFLLAKLEHAGFKFSPKATAEKRIRRIYLDLIGLPPSPEAVESFVRAADADDAVAWSNLVGELLASPHYGERWARHWMDVAGYSDSEGYTDADVERSNAWRYRDYVIRSFNEDKPFDTFITEQLAGDELVTSPKDNLSESDTQLLVATGFLRMAPDGTGGSVPDKELAKNDTIADTLNIVTSSLMGLTVGCAQCHDHRYDPISQADYYRLRAVFEPAFDCEKWQTPTQRRVLLYSNEDRKLADEVESKAKLLDAEHSTKQASYILATFEKQLARLPKDIHSTARAAHRTSAKKRTAEQKAVLKKHPSLNVTSSSLYLYDKKAADELTKMAAAAKKLRATKPKKNYLRALSEKAGRLPVTRLFYRGDHQQPKQELAPAGLTVVSMTADVDAIPANTPDLSTSGRRLALARRLTDPNHPLTARVLVNRIWRYHFGRGLVETPGDFGVLGERPSHPELLDWLASEFIAGGWRLKHLHRLILTSTAWQQAVRTNEQLELADPDNQLFGGARLMRLDAEVIRDCILAVSGKLNTKAFGPPVPVMADRVGRIVIGQENLNAGRPGSVIDMKGEQFRRSVYIQVRRSRPLSVLETFDRPAMSPNCDMRRPSNSSTQSLLMMNSDLLLQFSRHLADRLEVEAPTDPDSQIRMAWKLIYSRTATESEVSSAAHFVELQTEQLAKHADYKSTKKSGERTPADDAMAILCQMLLSSNEFLYID